MSEQHHEGCVIYVPTLAERFWRALGFHSRVPEMSEEGEKLPGWIMSKVVIKPSFADRLRFLICPYALVRIETRTDVPVATAVTAASFEVKHPYGET